MCEDKITQFSKKFSIDVEEIISRKLRGKYNTRTYAEHAMDLFYDKKGLKPYREYLIAKSKDDYPRRIAIPNGKDKIYIKLVQLVLQGAYLELSDKKGLLLPQVAIKNAIQALGNDKACWVYKVDISKCYDAIDHRKLFSLLTSMNFDGDLINNLKKIITNPIGSDGVITKGVPQGVAVSNLLAHIYLSEIDDYFLNGNQSNYIRYVDDILLVGLSNTPNIDELEKQVKELQLTLNEKKITRVEDKFKLTRKDPLTFLGYKLYFKNKELVVSCSGAAVDRMKRKIREELFYLSEGPFDGKTDTVRRAVFYLNMLITGTIVNDSIDEKIEKRYGWLFYYSQMNDLGLLYFLDRYVDRQVKKVLEAFKDLDDEIKISYSNILSTRKSFVKAYRELRYNYKESTYLFRPAKWTDDAIRNHMLSVQGIPEYKLKSEDIQKEFRESIFRKAKQEYRDLIEVYISK